MLRHAELHRRQYSVVTTMLSRNEIFCPSNVGVEVTVGQGQLMTHSVIVIIIRVISELYKINKIFTSKT